MKWTFLRVLVGLNSGLIIAHYVEPVWLGMLLIVPSVFVQLLAINRFQKWVES